MRKILLVQPWNYHDEGKNEFDLKQEWRNGPYSLLSLATILKNNSHEVLIVDMHRDLVVLQGDTNACFEKLKRSIRNIKPDIIGFTIFSVHYLEAKKAIRIARCECEASGINTIMLAGGIHATIEPERTLRDLEVDYIFCGEADISLPKFADGHNPNSIPGIVSKYNLENKKAENIKSLDSLPFPDWSQCDYTFYAHPSVAKLKVRMIKSLDMLMGRGCVNCCNFCAYNALSPARFYTAEYLVEQVISMFDQFKITGVYFTDSSIGNNRKLIENFCELILKKGLNKKIEWYGNMRADQIDEHLLKTMWSAGCRYLFYGFESGSQRVLDLMSKGISVDDNFKAADLHNRLKFPYHASIILGYPGEKEEDILQTFRLIKKTKPPSVGINGYVPLPGSPDYKRLKAEGALEIDDPCMWRIIGEVNSSRVYADVPEERFRVLFRDAENLAYHEIPRDISSHWELYHKQQANS